MAIPASGANSGANSGASSWFTLNNKPVIFQEGTENLDVQAMEYKQNYLRITENAPGPVEIFIDQEPLETYKYGLWMWRPATYAGLYELRVKVDGYPDQLTRIRVVPQYFTQTLYQKMQDDLSNIAAGLLFSLVSSVSERVESVRQLQEASPLQDYRHVRVIVDKLGDILSAIRREPYRVLASKSEQQDWQDVWQFNGESHALGGDCIHIPRRAGGQSRTLTLPTLWQVPQATPSYDVYENRLLKQFLQKQLVTKINSIQKRAESEIRERSVKLAHMQKYKFCNAGDEQREIKALEYAIDSCQCMKQRCLQWSSEVFLHPVRGEVVGGKATQVLLKHPHYSRFYKLYLQFQRQLQISLDSKTYIAELGLRRVSELYEMWSVFEITSMAIDELQQHGYEHVSQSLFYEVSKNSFHFDVRKNVASIILARDDIRVKIMYEPQYSNHSVCREETLVTTHGRSLPQTPDMAIEMYRHNRPQSVCIFDAKYKREHDSDGSFYPLVEDTNKMNNYAANIQYQSYDSTSKRLRTHNIVSAAYVLYPGNRVHEEANGKIGGLPLRPGISPSLRQAVKQKLHDILCDAGIIISTND
ncbi:MAG: hypothetical protein NVSMB44_24190 [Ktedonobacteraceae bacterium]